jgi:4-amino-4-deoxy-L-arabinose transferase-like glycosyltransferase
VRWVIPLGAVLIVLLYATRLEYAPIYLHHDEVLNAVNAADIAATGRDASGRFFPLYFHVGGNYWATPIVAYTTAVALIVAPLSEVTIRMVSVIVGLIDIVLVFAIARSMFRRSSAAAVAAVLLALTPAHFIHSRVAFDQIYQVVFVLAWLWCLARFFETGGKSATGVRHVSDTCLTPVFPVFSARLSAPDTADRRSDPPSAPSRR